MAQCHVHDYGNAITLQRCSLSYGCRHVGCLVASGGFYNDAGGFQPSEGVEPMVDVVGTPEQLSLLKELETAPYERAVEVAHLLGFEISDKDGCGICGWSWS